MTQVDNIYWEKIVFNQMYIFSDFFEFYTFNLKISFPFTFYWIILREKIIFTCMYIFSDFVASIYFIVLILKKCLLLYFIKPFNLMIDLLVFRWIFPMHDKKFSIIVSSNLTNVRWLLYFLNKTQQGKIRK